MLGNTQKHARNQVLTQVTFIQVLTLLLRSTRECVFALLLPPHPTVLHAAEEGPPGSGGQDGRSGGGVGLHLNPGCTQKDQTCGVAGSFVAARWGNSLAASMRRWLCCSDDANCSFTWVMSLGWMKSNRLWPVSSSCEPKHTTGSRRDQAATVNLTRY